MKPYSDWQRKREETEFTNISNEIEDIVRDPTDILRKIRESYNAVLINSAN